MKPKLWGGGRRNVLKSLSPDIATEICAYLDAASLLSLAKCSHATRDMVYSAEDVWKALFEAGNVENTRRVPHFPGAGSWREALIRAKRGRMKIYVRPLGLSKELLTLEVKRSTTLFGLKRQIRKLQVERFGITLDDFELVDARLEAPLGVKGRDALPPSDLSILFVSSDTILRSVRANEAFRRLLFRNQRPAWRKNLFHVPDGVELIQVFVGPSDTLQGFRSKASDNQGSPVECCTALEDLGNGKLTELVSAIQSTRSLDGKWEAYSKLATLLGDSNANIRYNAHKPFWTENVHPLLALAKGKRVPPTMRILAVVDLLKEYASHVLSLEYAVGILTRGFLTSGFPAVFIRLTTYIFPLIVHTQLKQVMEGEIDWIPFFFATKFLGRVSVLAAKASYPILVLSSAHQLTRTLLHTIFTEETDADDLFVYLCVLATGKAIKRVPEKSSLMRVAEKPQRPMGRNQARLKSSADLARRLIVAFFNLNDENSYAQITQRISARIWALFVRFAPRLSKLVVSAVRLLRKHPLNQYVISGLLWDQLNRRLSHAVTVSLPVYFYAVPFLFTVMLVRVRVALSDSYYYMLYL
eukprot:CAMPEP_0184507176 /NCGR_PEP_ID=MMETSP0198_2-20121128/106_1 /TAXON_ID=1112570 /ORGANISM="Thraustochytrium sp., Strain LLF1b" /LENGTH=583 /DNA_ID=CAMNT_0026896913 /DNA_START=274 /DNA_END=2025 /DNA_ORIENTATION=-